MLVVDNRCKWHQKLLFLLPPTLQFLSVGQQRAMRDHLGTRLLQHPQFLSNSFDKLLDRSCYNHQDQFVEAACPSCFRNDIPSVRPFPYDHLQMLFRKYRPLDHGYCHLTPKILPDTTRNLAEQLRIKQDLGKIAILHVVLPAIRVVHAVLPAAV